MKPANEQHVDTGATRMIAVSALTIGLVLLLERIGDAISERISRKADPVYLAAARVPVDDELLSTEDLAAIAEARASVVRGEYSTLEDFRRRQTEARAADKAAV